MAFYSVEVYFLKELGSRIKESTLLKRIIKPMDLCRSV